MFDAAEGPEGHRGPETAEHNHRSTVPPFELFSLFTLLRYPNVVTKFPLPCIILPCVLCIFFISFFCRLFLLMNARARSPCGVLLEATLLSGQSEACRVPRPKFSCIFHGSVHHHCTLSVFIAKALTVLSV